MRLLTFFTILMPTLLASFTCRADTGYQKTFIDATVDYIARMLQRSHG